MGNDSLGQLNLATTAVKMIENRLAFFIEDGDTDKQEYIVLKNLLKVWKNMKADAAIKYKQKKEIHDKQMESK